MLVSSLTLIAASLTALPIPAVLAHPRLVPLSDVEKRDGPSSNGAKVIESDVLILGAGAAGISAASTLSKANITSFHILDSQSSIGGRVKHASFGHNAATNAPYTIELGANWVHGQRKPNGTENPLWTLVKKYNITNVLDGGDQLLLFDPDGSIVPQNEIDDLSQQFDNATTLAGQEAQRRSEAGEDDISVARGLKMAGWDSSGKTVDNARMRAWEVSNIGLSENMKLSNISLIQEGGQTGDEGFGVGDMLVFDQRGYNTVLVDLANEYLKPNDPRLHLNTEVSEIKWSSDSVMACTKDKVCYKAKHAICTFSLGVLQKAIQKEAPVSFSPDLPDWKQDALSAFGMGIYTKMFFQFDPAKIFWNQTVNYWLYASDKAASYYVAWESLSRHNLLKDSGLLFVTVIPDESERVEGQTDAQTKAEGMEVLRTMYGAENVPEPIDFTYFHWGMAPFSYGSYSYWPVGATDEQQEDVGEKVGSLWFAGEHTSADYRATVHGALIEGGTVAADVVKALKRM